MLQEQLKSIALPQELRDRVLDLLRNGTSLRKTALQTGVKYETVRTWARKERISNRVVENPENSRSDASTRVRDGLARRLERVVANLEKTDPPKSMKGIAQENNLLRPLVQNAKDVFGWTEGNSGGPISITFLNSAKVGTTPPTIDVQALSAPVPRPGPEQACLSAPAPAPETG